MHKDKNLIWNYLEVDIYTQRTCSEVDMLTLTITRFTFRLLLLNEAARENRKLQRRWRSSPVDAILPSAGGTREGLERNLKTDGQYFPLRSTTNGWDSYTV